MTAGTAQGLSSGQQVNSINGRECRLKCHLVIGHKNGIGYGDNDSAQAKGLKEAARASMADYEVSSFHVGVHGGQVLHEFYLQAAGQLRLNLALGQQHIRNVLAISSLRRHYSMSDRQSQDD